MASQRSNATTLPFELVRDILEAAARVHSVEALKWTSCLLLVSRDVHVWLLPAIYGMFVVRPKILNLSSSHSFRYASRMAETTGPSGSTRQLEQMLRDPDDPRRAVVKTIIVMGPLPPRASDQQCALAPWTVPVLIGTDGFLTDQWPLYGTLSYAGQADVILRPNDPMDWTATFHREPTRSVRIQALRDDEWLQFIERTHDVVDASVIPTHVHLQIELNYKFDQTVGPLAELAQRILRSRPQTRFVLCTRRIAAHARVAAREQLIVAFAEIPRARLTWSTYFWDDPPRTRPSAHITYLREGRDPWEIGDPL